MKGKYVGEVSQAKRPWCGCDMRVVRSGNADQLERYKETIFVLLLDVKCLGVEGTDKNELGNGRYILISEWCNWLTRVPYKDETSGFESQFRYHYTARQHRFAINLCCSRSIHLW